MGSKKEQDQAAEDSPPELAELQYTYSNIGPGILYIFHWESIHPVIFGFLSPYVVQSSSSDYSHEETSDDDKKHKLYVKSGGARRHVYYERSSSSSSSDSYSSESDDGEMRENNNREKIGVIYERKYKYG